MPTTSEDFRIFLQKFIKKISAFYARQTGISQKSSFFLPSRLEKICTIQKSDVYLHQQNNKTLKTHNIMKTINNEIEKKDIFVYADEEHLEVIRTTDNERALVYFGDFEDAKRAADEVGGIVSLICRRDGERFWSNQGWTDKPIEFDDSFIDCEQALFIYDSEQEFHEYFLEVLAEKIEEKCELDELAELSAKGRDTYDAICSMDEDEVLIYYPYDQSYDIRKRYDTIIGYDSMTYAIAVVVKIKDED